MARTSVSDIQADIHRLLADYVDGVGEEVAEAAEKIAKEAAKKLKTTSPEMTGSYRKGWRAKKVGTAWVVHNKTDYQLTHLLEKGHAKASGGRVAPVVHIEPVEQAAINEFISEIERAINNR